MLTKENDQPAHTTEIHVSVNVYDTLPVSQTLPVQPGAHAHLNPPNVLVQVAAFKQGKLEQLMESEN